MKLTMDPDHTEYKLQITDFNIVGHLLELDYIYFRKHNWSLPKKGDTIIVEGKTRTIKFVFSSKSLDRINFRPEVYFNKPDILTSRDIESTLMIIVDDFHDKH